jgi:hypothetical protein
LNGVFLCRPHQLHLGVCINLSRGENFQAGQDIAYLKEWFPLLVIPEARNDVGHIVLAVISLQVDPVILAIIYRADLILDLSDLALNGGRPQI